jgi:hypothetical protein
MGFVYCIASGNFYKIGIANDVQSRLAALQTGNPVTLNLVSQYEFDNPLPVEQALHQRFKSINESLEWFRMDHQDLELFERICQLLGGTKIHGTTNADSEDIDSAEVAYEEAPDTKDEEYINSMLEDGWRIESWSKAGTDWRYWSFAKRGENQGRRGGKRLRIYGGTWKSLPQSIKDKMG